MVFGNTGTSLSYLLLIMQEPNFRGLPLSYSKPTFISSAGRWSLTSLKVAIVVGSNSGNGFNLNIVL